MDKVLCDKAKRMVLTAPDNFELDIGDFKAARFSICSACNVTGDVRRPLDMPAGDAFRFALIWFKDFPMNKMDDAV